MADTTTIPTAEGGTARSSGPNWIMLVMGGVAVVIVLYYIMRASGGGSSQTTAAGTSINAALGSIQEENLNLMGQLGQARNDVLTGQAGLSSQMSGIDSHVATSEADLAAQLNGLNTSVLVGNQTTTDLRTAMDRNFNALTTQVGGVATQVNNVNGAVNAAASQENQYWNQLQSQYGSMWNMVSSNDAALNQELAGLTGQLGGLGSQIAGISHPEQFNGIDLSKYSYIWYQPPGADQFHAAMWKVQNGVPTAISWAQYVAQTGRQSFDFSNPSNLVIANR